MYLGARPALSMYPLPFQQIGSVCFSWGRRERGGRGENRVSGDETGWGVWGGGGVEVGWGERDATTEPQVLLAGFSVFTRCSLRRRPPPSPPLPPPRPPRRSPRPPSPPRRPSPRRCRSPRSSRPPHLRRREERGVGRALTHLHTPEWSLFLCCKTAQLFAKVTVNMQIILHIENPYSSTPYPNPRWSENSMDVTRLGDEWRCPQGKTLAVARGWLLDYFSWRMWWLHLPDQRGVISLTCSYSTVEHCIIFSGDSFRHHCHRVAMVSESLWPLPQSGLPWILEPINSPPCWSTHQHSPLAWSHWSLR